MRALPLALITAFTTLAAPGPMRAQAPAPADLVLVNGTVLTVDATDSVAQAVAIAGGKIAAVGSNDAIRARVGPSTQVVDLRGRTATPGLIDTHIHFSEVDALFAVELSEAASIADVLAKVREQVAKSKPGEWVRGRGWDEGNSPSGATSPLPISTRSRRTTRCGWCRPPATTASPTATR